MTEIVSKLDVVYVYYSLIIDKIQQNSREANAYYSSLPRLINDTPFFCAYSQNMFEMLYSWRQIAAKLEAGEITKEEYDHWRYKYPEFDFSKKDWKKVRVSQDLSDILVEGLKEE